MIWVKYVYDIPKYFDLYLTVQLVEILVNYLIFKLFKNFRLLMRISLFYSIVLKMYTCYNDAY